MTDDPPQDRHTVTGRRILRRNVEAAIAKATMPVAFIECDMEGEDLSGLDVTGYSFERCTLIDCDLSGLKAQRTTWRSCRARKAVIRHADLTDASIEAGDWNNTDWRGSLLPGLRVKGAKLTGASFREARTLGIAFEDCPMQSAELCGISIRRMRLGRCDMTRADLRECDMRQASYDAGSSLAHAQVAGCRFEDADLRGVDLSGHGVESLRHLASARISAQQAAAIVAGAGLRVG